MMKKRFFSIMAKASLSEIQVIAEPLTHKYSIQIIQEPAKSLAMVQLRETVRESLFYIGEVLVVEAIVSIGDVKGMAVTLGDDFEKVLAMAILDASLNKKIEESSAIEQSLFQLERKQIEKEQKENALFQKTKVNFNSMDQRAKL
jgi:alpha-D-ribose 1-methylphosphonate 5-triphosphate synthase subunit PhnG